MGRCPHKGMKMQDLDERVRETVAQAYAHAPAVRARLMAVGLTPADIQSVADLSKLPILPKDQLVSLQQADPPFGGMLGAPPESLRHIFMSPGPLYEPDAGDDDSLLAMAQLALSRTGFAPGDVVLNTLSYHLVPAGLLVDQALVALGCTVVPGGVGNADLQVKLLHDLRITAYAGTPSFLVALLRKAEEMGMRPISDLALRKAFLTAEPLFAETRRLLTETYGLTIGNAYATAELGFLALNTSDGMAMALLPLPIIEVVDPQTGWPVGPGEAGEVVVTNFSRAYPLIRLGTGDMALNIDPRPGDSRQDERAIILVGRSGEAVKVRGMFVHPNQVRFALGALAAAFQGVVTRQAERDWWTLNVVLAGGQQASEALAEQIKEQVRGVCRVRVDTVRFVDALPPGAAAMSDQRAW